MSENTDKKKFTGTSVREAIKFENELARKLKQLKEKHNI